MKEKNLSVGDLLYKLVKECVKSGIDPKNCEIVSIGTATHTDAFTKSHYYVFNLRTSQGEKKVYINELKGEVE